MVPIILGYFGDYFRGWVGKGVDKWLALDYANNKLQRFSSNLFA